MSKFNFVKVLKNIEAMKRDLPRLLANDAQNYFLSSFKKQGWNGNHWEEVQRRIEGTPEYKYPKKKGLSRRTLPILQGRTGRLRRGVHLLTAGMAVKYSKFNFSVTLRMDKSVVPYASYINKGTPNMVARKYMGDSPGLRKILRGRISKYLDKSFKTAA